MFELGCSSTTFVGGEVGVGRRETHRRNVAPKRAILEPVKSPSERSLPRRAMSDRHTARRADWRQRSASSRKSQLNMIATTTAAITAPIAPPTIVTSQGLFHQRSFSIGAAGPGLAPARVRHCLSPGVHHPTPVVGRLSLRPRCGYRPISSRESARRSDTRHWRSPTAKSPPPRTYADNQGTLLPPSQRARRSSRRRGLRTRQARFRSASTQVSPDGGCTTTSGAPSPPQ
jgi:hypothetical protein